ncbi:MAG: AbrB/MazE/SpoVT family DNA-binding domain-containing protein [Actinobacteria bacterium]|nr:AbrB/MazE/SpoVT family DNA-binding domain-containing protein [Actinomycetota bacterium]
MVRQLSNRNTITIPSEILKHIDAQTGDLFEITDDGYRIILIPKIVEDKFTKEEWEKLEILASDKGKQYSSTTDVKNHLKGL